MKCKDCKCELSTGELNYCHTCADEREFERLESLEDARRCGYAEGLDGPPAAVPAQGG